MWKTLPKNKPCGRSYRRASLFDLVVQILKIFLIYDAAKLLAACRAGQSFGIKLLIEANRLAARGANDLKVLLIAAAAVTVAVAIVTVIAITIAVAIAVAIAVTVAITLILKLLVQEILDCLQVVIQLLDIVAQIIQILVDLVDILLDACNLCSQIVHQLKKSCDDLAFLGGLIKLESLSETLDICGFFGQIHD